MVIGPGEMLERYAIESLLGRGGMGEVYRATDTRLRRKVALKVVREDKQRPEAVARLFREARAAAALSHAHVVAVHDVGEMDGVFYIVMELIDGQPMRAYVEDPSVPVAKKLGWLTDVAQALSCAHEAGIVHRDVKPANVMISDDGVVKVVDFGLARPFDPVSFRTKDGELLGTPRYMAPEQLDGAPANTLTDQYAWAVTAYELLAGKHPERLLARPPLPLDAIAAGVSSDVALIVARAMARLPRDRFADMAALCSALEDARAGRSVELSVVPTIRDVAQPQGVPSTTADAQPSTPLGIPPTIDEPPIPSTKPIDRLSDGPTVTLDGPVVTSTSEAVRRIAAPTKPSAQPVAIETTLPCEQPVAAPIETTLPCEPRPVVERPSRTTPMDPPVQLRARVPAAPSAPAYTTPPAPRRSRLTAAQLGLLSVVFALLVAAVVGVGIAVRSLVE